jgi:hypothetical protein
MRSDRSSTSVRSDHSVPERSHAPEPERLEAVQSEHAEVDGIGRQSLIRRIRFAESCRYHLDVARNALGWRRRLDTFQWFYYALTLAFDLTEWVRTGVRISHPGRAQHAALLAPIRLEQDPRYRAYWYDPKGHALVGVLLGLDLHRFEGRYYLLEANLTAGLMKERRALYNNQIDPFLGELIATARKFQFEQLVLYRRSWTSEYLEEFAAATRATGIRVVPASAMKQRGDPLVNPLTALPRELAANTMYVVCTAVSDSPIFEFLHHKRCMARWFADILAETEPSPLRLAAVPTYEEPRVPEGPFDPRWPNLVVKLANSDEGKDVLMGHFESKEHARQALGLSDDAVALPRQFKSRFDRYWIDRLFPGTLTAVYQPFVPPEVVEGFPMMIRMEMFISPLVDRYLSSHGTVGGEKLLEHAPRAVLLNRCPYNVSVPPGRFVRLDQRTENELREVAREFGALARGAIRKKFKVSPTGEVVLKAPLADGPAD